MVILLYKHLIEEWSNCYNLHVIHSIASLFYLLFFGNVLDAHSGTAITLIESLGVSRVILDFRTRFFILMVHLIHPGLVQM